MFPYKASQLAGSAGHLTNEVKALQEELNEATHSLKQTNRAYLEQRVELSRAKQTITELKQTVACAGGACEVV